MSTPVAPSERAPRSRLARAEARSRYVRLAFDVILGRARAEAEIYDAQLRAAATGEAGGEAAGAVRALGIFSRLDANAVAALDGKTRGAVTHVFGSQHAFQVAAMQLESDVRDFGGTEGQVYPAPGDFETSYAWARAIGRHEWARGPQYEATPEVGYAWLWVMWLTQIPYAMWSPTLSASARDEFDDYIARFEERLVRPALAHFGEEPLPGYSPTAIAVAWCTAVEGLWLSQCVQHSYRGEGGEGGQGGISTQVAAENTLAILWSGAVRPVAGDGGDQHSHD